MAYGDTDGKGEKVRKVLSALIFPAWITFMALAGFYIPTLMMKLPFFQVNGLEVEGTRVIESREVRSLIQSMEGNLLKLRSDDLLVALNSKTHGRVKAVYLSKDFGLRGVSLKIKIEERIPVAKLKVKGKTYLIDREGFLFPPLKGEKADVPSIVTRDPERVVQNFKNLYSGVFASGVKVDKVIIGNESVIVKLRNRVAILPSIELIKESASARLKMIYNFPKGKVDLRYDRFILVRN